MNYSLEDIIFYGVSYFSGKSFYVDDINNNIYLSTYETIRCYNINPERPLEELDININVLPKISSFNAFEEIQGIQGIQGINILFLNIDNAYLLNNTDLNNNQIYLYKIDIIKIYNNTLNYYSYKFLIKLFDLSKNLNTLNYTIFKYLIANYYIYFKTDYNNKIKNDIKNIKNEYILVKYTYYFLQKLLEYIEPLKLKPNDMKILITRNNNLIESIYSRLRLNGVKFILLNSLEKNKIKNGKIKKNKNEDHKITNINNLIANLKIS